MALRHPLVFSRRAFLAGAAGVAGSAALAACGANTGAEDDTTTTDGGGPVLAALFNPGTGYATVGEPQRLTFGVFNNDHSPLSNAPQELDFQLLFGRDMASAEKVGDPL